ncbi:MAG: hypothetical protein QXH30_03160 [Candidatus Bilamarchaeaceae archaeon]
MFEIYTKMFQALLPGKVEEFAKKEKGTVKDAIMVLVFAWVVTFFLDLIGVGLAMGRGAEQLAPLTNLFGGTVIGGLTIVTVVVNSIIGLIWAIILNYLVQWLGSFVAKSAFKGTGNFPQQFYVAMLFTGAIAIIGSVLNILFGLLPMLGILNVVIGTLLLLWSIYLLFVTVKAVQKLEVLGAAVTTLAMVIGAFVLTLVVIAIVSVVLVALGVGAAGAIAGVSNP